MVFFKKGDHVIVKETLSGVGVRKGQLLEITGKVEHQMYTMYECALIHDFPTKLMVPSYALHIATDSDILQTGDIVECIDDLGMPLTNGSLYRVTQNDDNRTPLTWIDYLEPVGNAKDVDGGAYASRFIKVELEPSVDESETASESSYDTEELVKPSRYTTKTGKQIKHLIRDELLPEDIDPYEAALLFNVYKYLFRYPNKQPIDSLKKAKIYIDDIILEIEGREKDV